MQIGDKVQFSGTVRDIVEKSVLVVSEDAMHQREYWFQEVHLTVTESAPPAPPPVAEQLPAKPVEPEDEAEQLPTHPAPGRPAHQPAVPPVRPTPTPVRR